MEKINIVGKKFKIDIKKQKTRNDKMYFSYVSKSYSKYRQNS